MSNNPFQGMKNVSFEVRDVPPLPAPRTHETLGFKVFYYLFMLVCLCTPPLGWTILYMGSKGGLRGKPGAAGPPFYPAPQPVYWVAPPTGMPDTSLRAPVTAPERFGGHWTAQDTLHSAQTLRIR